MIIQIDTFDLRGYDLFEVITHSDPYNPDKGSMVIKIEGDIEDRVELILGVVPHVEQISSNLVIQTDDMPESAKARVVPKLQSIPRNHRYMLTWESDTPYFVGVATGRKYQL